MSGGRVCPNCGHVISPLQRLSVSVHPSLTAWVREYAAAHGLTLSAVIAEAIRRHQQAAQP